MKQQALFLLLTFMCLLGCFACEDLFVYEQRYFWYQSYISSKSEEMITVHTELRDQGREHITEHGYCWSTSPNPTIVDDTLSLGKLELDRKTFQATIDSLQANVTYYIRAFAIENGVVIYDEIELITKTNSWLFLTGLSFGSTSADISLEIDGAYPRAILEYGLVWGENENPSFEDNVLSLGTGIAGELSDITINGLNTTTNYYIRPYLVSGIDTSYNDTESFTTLP